MSTWYEELRPPAELSPWVVAFWQIRASAGGGLAPVQRVLPDGSVDIVFDFGRWNAGASSFCDVAAAPAVQLVGTMTRALVVPLPGTSDLFGIRFRPGVIGSLTACPGHRVQDLSLPLSEAGIHLDVSDDQLFREGTLAQRVRCIQPALRRHLGARPPGNPAVLAAIAAWEAAIRQPYAELPSVAAMARAVGISERSFERRFAEWVGYRPAQFRRLVRFRAALKLSCAGRRSWAQVAARCGYADQPHLSRDFSEFASTTAGAWAAEQRPVGFVQDSPAVAL